MILLVALVYLIALASAGVSFLSGQRWPLLFALFMAACGVILHVADLLYEDGGSDAARISDASDD